MGMFIILFARKNSQHSKMFRVMKFARENDMGERKQEDAPQRTEEGHSISKGNGYR